VITQEERLEIVKKGQEDGARLFRVSETIYKGLIILNWICGIVGTLFGFGFFIASSHSYGTDGSMVAMGFGILIATAIGCVVNYVLAVLTTHGAKVLVHILFANLAILGEEKQ